MSEKKLQPRQLLPFWGMWIASGVLSLADWWALRLAATAVAAGVANAVPVEVQMERQWFLRWPAAAADKFALVCFGILAMLSIISFESLYRDGLLKGKARVRFAIIAGIQVGLLLLSLLAVAIVSRLVS